MAVLRTTIDLARLADCGRVRRGFGANPGSRALLADGLCTGVVGKADTERFDALHASAFDLDANDPVMLITGTAAEFGGRSGAVVSIDARRAGLCARARWNRNLSAVDGSAGGGTSSGPCTLWLGRRVESDRFLDPVDESTSATRRTLRGRRARLRRATGTGQLTFGAAGARTRLDVPNDAERRTPASGRCRRSTTRISRSRGSRPLRFRRGRRGVLPSAVREQAVGQRHGRADCSAIRARAHPDRSARLGHPSTRAAPDEGWNRGQPHRTGRTLHIRDYRPGYGARS